ncbi:hypothetical protein LENED_002095 [Lentinula edodes]|uniref:Uncharacterized protein n=1 Tax=Lentinula edodes TaxID=5353 RepID=A0A1Q3DZX3_LENED|nr:hypothetical protein LENED_002095 [Lentinula edodes]
MARWTRLVVLICVLLLSSSASAAPLPEVNEPYWEEGEGFPVFNHNAECFGFGVCDSITVQFLEDRSFEYQNL